MRMNRGTIGLLVISLLVIVAVLVLNNTALAPEESTPTPESGGPFFPDLEVDALTRLSISGTAQAAEGSEEEAAGPLQTTLSKDEGGAWVVEEATNSTDRATDQDAAAQAAENFVALRAADSFTAENLADFGLEEPAYTITAEDGENSYTLLVGNENPSGNRYYVLRDGDEEPTVYLVTKSTLDDLINLLDEPPYVPPPTATPTPYPTPNPYSEVEQTATAQVEATATAEFEATATAEAETATEETTEEPTEEATEDTGS